MTGGRRPATGRPRASGDGGTAARCRRPDDRRPAGCGRRGTAGYACG